MTTPSNPASAATVGRATLRVAVLGLSGAGKSTCAGLITGFAARRGLSVARIPLARPLYELQERVYVTAGVQLRPGAQDQLLLEDLAGHLRRINPEALVADFLARMNQAVDDGVRVLINDDLREPHVDAPAVRAAGFRILRITCDEAVRQVRLKKRGDLTRTDRSTREIDLIGPDAVIDNSAGLDDYRTAVHDLLASWL